jgi:double-strand break repair protein MRE11
MNDARMWTLHRQSVAFFSHSFLRFSAFRERCAGTFCSNSGLREIRLKPFWRCQRAMDDDIIRILVTTDNHLGFAERDPVRCDDCYAVFEEVLATARRKKVDFVLMAGDMFHENRPTRRTMHNTMELLRRYCLGEDPVYTAILNDQKEIFKASFGRVNYEDPYLSVCLPVFSIHGNHDDPSREGGSGEALAALDLLAVSNLINYFGKADRVEDIEITPVLMSKGTTKIAIYGLGAIRDERLNRMWNQKNVKFVRLTEEQGREEYFNIFVLHQNRDYGRGAKNCVHESMIPEWMGMLGWVLSFCSALTCGSVAVFSQIW